MTYSTVLLAVERSGRGDAVKSSRTTSGVCAIIWRPFYRSWNDPQALKDGRHPHEPARFVSQLPSDYVIGAHVGLQEALAIVRDSCNDIT